MSSLDPLDVLLSGKSSPEALRTVLKKLSHECCIDENLKMAHVERGLIDALLGICRGSGKLQVVADTLTVLAIVIHGNDAWKNKIIHKHGLMPILALFIARTNIVDEEEKIMRLKAHEQAAFVIRKLSFMNQDCQTAIGNAGGVEILINMLDVFSKDGDHNNCCLVQQPYSNKAKQLLEELTFGQNLIGKVWEEPHEVGVELMKTCSVRGSFNTGSAVEKVFKIKLFGNSGKNVLISDEMIKTGLVWPDMSCDERDSDRKKDAAESSAFEDVKVTEVIDGAHFWGHVGTGVIRRKIDEIAQMLQNQELAALSIPPHPGDIFCTIVMTGGSPDYMRVQVLEVLPYKQVKVFAVDHGYTLLVQSQDLWKMSQVCEVMPFQASLCCLFGVQSPPNHPDVLEHAAASLRNLSHDGSTYKLQITSSNGIETLIKLCYVPKKEICMQAAATMLNLATHFKIRARIGFLGGIKAMLDLCCRYTEDERITLFATGALRNMMLDVIVNRTRVADMDGLIILTHVYNSTNNAVVKEQTLGALKNLVGNCWSLLDGDNSLDMRGCVDNEKKPSARKFSLAVTDENASMPVIHRRRKKRPLRPGEVEPNPTHVALTRAELHSSCSEYSDSDGRDLLRSGEDTDGEMNGERLLNKNMTFGDGGTDEVIDNSQYIQSQKVPFFEDDQHEFRSQPNIKKFAACTFTRAACAFLNSGKGGIVYLGIRKDGLVVGLEINRKERDSLRLGVDELLNNFDPPVRHDKYKVQFVPVMKVKGSRKVVLEDRFIVEIIFSKTIGTMYATKEGKVFFRQRDLNEEVNFQHIREKTVNEEELGYNAEIRSLKSELTEVKKQLDAKDSPHTTTITVPTSLISTLERLSVAAENGQNLQEQKNIKIPKARGNYKYAEYAKDTSRSVTGTDPPAFASSNIRQDDSVSQENAQEIGRLSRGAADREVSNVTSFQTSQRIPGSETSQDIKGECIIS